MSSAHRRGTLVGSQQRAMAGVGSCIAAIEVEISDRQTIMRIGGAGLVRFVRKALRAEEIGQATVGILLVDDRRMAALHSKWLGLQGPTDVITFDLSDGIKGGPLLGDIAVSTETARRMSRDYGWTPRQELAYYVIHGLLHLTGYDDTSPVLRRAMRARERTLMQTLGMPCPRRNTCRKTKS